MKGYVLLLKVSGAERGGAGWGIPHSAAAIFNNLDFSFSYFQMVCNYVEKTVRQQWSTKSMELAVDAVIRGVMGYKIASDQFEVPQTV